jgi:tetratricopeptide (TPR) repeat protein
MKFSLLVAVLVVLAGVAHADNKDKADALFKHGKKLMAEKRYADACEAFENSFKLDPGIGTQLNIARCYEEWGKLGRAFVAYQTAEKIAKDANDSRVPKIHELVAALEPEVPHLTIKAPKGRPADLHVTLDGNPVETLDAALVVDPGPHTIEWWVTGGAKKSKVVAIDRGGDSEVSIDVPKAEAAGTGDQRDNTGGATTATHDAPKPRGRNQRLGGIALGGAGVLAIGISSYMALSARSKYNDALDMYCGGMKNNCDMTGLAETHDARSTANNATIVFLVGAALVGGGAALYFLAPTGAASTAGAEQPSSAFYVTPAVSREGVGVVLGGAL